MNRLPWLSVLLAVSIQVMPAAAYAGDFQNYNPGFELFHLPNPEANKVQAMAQDSLGYLWFATQAGLIRYDGQNFIEYTHSDEDPNSIQSDYVESIFIDSKGIFWLTHWQSGSLTSFDPVAEIFTKYQNDPKDPESLLPGEFSVVVEDKPGYIWIGGQQGLNRLDRKTGKVKRFQNDPLNPGSLSCNKVRALYVDRRGTLWVGTGFPWEDDPDLFSEGGLNRYNPGTETFTRYLHNPDDPNSLSNNKIRALLEDSKGNFWVGTSGDGLHLMDRQTGKFRRLSFDPKNPMSLSRPYISGTRPETIPQYSHITSVYEDRENRIWITAVEGGLNVYDPLSGLMRHFEKGPGDSDLKNNFLWNTFQSRDHTLWIITAGDGAEVYKVKDRNFQFPFFSLNEDKFGTLKEVHGILKDKEGRIWIIQNNPGKVLRIDRQKNLVEEIPVGGKRITNDVFFGGISADLDGNIWISTWNGFYRCKAKESEFQLFRTGKFPGDNLMSSPAPGIQTRDGYFWFSLWWDGGLMRYDPRKDETVIFKNKPDDPSSIAGDRILCTYEDGNGNLWIGGGSITREPDRPLFIDRYNPQTSSFEHFIENKNIKGIASAITSDNKGNIWFIDFSEGLYKLNPLTKEIRKFSTSNYDLPKSQFFTLVKDNTGNLWLSAEKYIIEFDPLSETASVFDKFQGVKEIRYSFNSGSIASDGEIFFARRNGFHYFYPEKILPDKKNIKPDVRITGFQLFDDQNNSSGHGAFRTILNNPYLTDNQIHLTYTENVFSFSVAGFDFYNPESNRLQYMLEGFDRGWRSDLINGITPYYINVPPGNYTFRVRGTNSYGLRDKDGIRLNVTISPPWWKNTWAYILYGLIVIGGIFAVDRIQRRRIHNKQQIQAKEKELFQAREIEQAYNKLKVTQAQLIHAEKMASLGELTAGIAHEIQNPLNFVNNFSNINSELIDELEEEIDNGNFDEVRIIAKGIRDNQQKINYHGKRAESIIRGMLQHSRGSAGQKELTDINMLADEYLRLSYHGYKAKDFSFNAVYKLEADELLPKIKVDRQEIGRVLLNLINNAFYAVNEKGKQVNNGYAPAVVVTTKRVDGKVEIVVSDNGIGIPDSLKGKIFQPFFTTKPSGSGTGLGLSMSYDIIIKGHGGDLKMESIENSGTIFTIELPILQ